MLKSAEDLLPAELNISTDPAMYGEGDPRSEKFREKPGFLTYSKPVLSLGNRRTRTLLLKEEPGKTEQDPVEVGEEKSVLVDESIAGEGDQNRKIEGQSDDITPWSSVHCPIQSRL